MKRILYFVALAMLTIACNNEDSTTGETQINNKPFTLEGQWYVSGSTEGSVLGDSATYKYNDFIYGYQEFSFEPIQGEKNYYSVTGRMRLLKRKDSESDIEYTNRIQNGAYTADELIMYDYNNCKNWFVSDQEVYIPSNNKKYKGLLVAKIIKSSYNTFTIASIISEVPYTDLFWEGPLVYKYYITFTRIK